MTMQLFPWLGAQAASPISSWVLEFPVCLRGNLLLRTLLPSGVQ